jgi:hypothetical protein
LNAFGSRASARTKSGQDRAASISSWTADILHRPKKWGFVVIE